MSLSPRTDSTTRRSTPRTFYQFSQLHEELVINVLSYLADVPYKYSSKENSSTLTHSLPLVCKKFYSICRNNDYLWAIAMERLVEGDSELWGGALQKFIGHHSSADEQIDTSAISLSNACQLMQDVISTNGIQTRYGIHGELYRYLLSNFIRYMAPVFYMPDESIERGDPFGLHFFEPRYRRLIAEVMAPYPEQFRNGTSTIPENGITNPPTFIYGNRSPLKHGQAAIIVQVLQCYIRENGTADVFLLPLQHARLERVWEQADMNDHLYFARVMRMGEEEQHQLEVNDGMRRNASLGGRDVQMPQMYVNEVLQALGRREEFED